jgi:hypothetical protein
MGRQDGKQGHANRGDITLPRLLLIRRFAGSGNRRRTQVPQVKDSFSEMGIQRFNQRFGEERRKPAIAGVESGIPGLLHGFRVGEDGCSKQTRTTALQGRKNPCGRGTAAVVLQWAASMRASFAC